MRVYILIILLITSFVVLYVSYNNSIFDENLENPSNIPDSSNINISNSENLRDLFSKIYYICNEDEYSVNKDGLLHSTCYKINTIYNYFKSIVNFVDIKTEEEIMKAYGPAKENIVLGQQIKVPHPIPIISSNYDYYSFIILIMHIKVLKSYYDSKIFVNNGNDSNGKPSIMSMCESNDKDTKEFVMSAKIMLDNISAILSYFQFQTDKSDIVTMGDSPDTGLGYISTK